MLADHEQQRVVVEETSLLNLIVRQFSRRSVALSTRLTILAVLLPLLTASQPANTATLDAPAASASEVENIWSRNMAVSRAGAVRQPRGEAEQARFNDWPLYRTPRGQAAFNAAMATLKATDGTAPSASAFKGCAGLACELTLPVLTAEGWLPPGRLWVSPTQYVLIVHSPRLPAGQPYRRRAFKSMRYFVLHEFQNGTRNSDPYDTISAHRGPVFVPLYMGKQATDAQGRNFVTVLQVAPYDVVSIHASNMGSSGPGIEVAKNGTDTLQPLQGLAGIVVTAMLKAEAPHLKVVNHRGTEGLPMLKAWQGRLAKLSRAGGPKVTLPFTPALPDHVVTATARLDDLLLAPGASPDRANVLPKPQRVATYALIEPIRPVTQGDCEKLWAADLDTHCWAEEVEEFTLIEPIREVSQ